MKHYTLHNALTEYFPIPREVLTLALPFSAMILYGLLLDRGSLSRKYGYVDENGWIYVVYPVLELTHTLGISATSVKKDPKRLEEAGLICRIRRSRKEANRTYLLAPENALTATG